MPPASSYSGRVGVFFDTSFDTNGDNFGILGGRPPGINLSQTLIGNIYGAARLFGTPTVAGTYTVSWETTNNDGDVEDSGSFGFTIAPPDTIPSAPTLGNRSNTVGQSVNTLLAAGTGGNPPLTYSISGLPNGLSSSGRTVSGTPTTVQTRTVTYTVTDNDGDSDSETFTWTIRSATPPDTTPNLPNIANRSHQQSIFVSVSLPAASSGNSPLQYSITGLPTGLSFNSNTRTYFGIPSMTGAYTVTYTVTDTDGDSDSETFSISITLDTNGDALVVDSTGDELWRINVANPDDTSGIYGLIGILPSGLTIPAGITLDTNGDALVVDSTGDELWRINVANPDDTSGIYGLIGILPSGLETPTGITLDTNGDALVVDSTGDELWRINVANPDDTSGIYGLIGTLPSGLTIPAGITLDTNGDALVVDADDDELWRINVANPDDTSGIYGLIGILPSGLETPTGITLDTNGDALVVDSTGNELWRINVANPDDTSGIYGLIGILPSGLETPLGITIGEPPDITPSLPSIADLSSTAGTSVDITLAAASSGDAPLAYTIAGLPTGLMLAGRNITGIPTIPGIYNIVYTVTDDDGDTDTATFTFTITAPTGMTRDPDSLLIRKWASNGDVAIPEDTTLVRPDGWDNTYSTVGGNEVERAIWNQLFREVTAMLLEINQHGVPQWDSRVNYVHPSITFGSDNVIYKSLASNGPTIIIQNPVTDSSNTYWTPAFP